MSISMSMKALLGEASGDAASVHAAVERATANNDHTGALLHWAEFLKAAKWVKVLKLMVALQDAWGSLPTGMEQARKEVSSALYDLTKSQHGKQTAEWFYDAT
jgi:hypothetical protein